MILNSGAYSSQSWRDLGVLTLEEVYIVLHIQYKIRNLFEGH